MSVVAWWQHACGFCDLECTCIDAGTQTSSDGKVTAKVKLKGRPKEATVIPCRSKKAAPRALVRG
jgi:hypothetical protein